MTVIFTNNYSDLHGSYRTGWRASLPEALARQLIDSGTAIADEPETPSTPAAPVPTTPKRTRKPKATPPAVEQYVTPTDPDAID